MITPEMLAGLQVVFVALTCAGAFIAGVVVSA